jgi:hypothetical protein
MTPEYDQDEVKKAFEVIKSAMKADYPGEQGSYAHSWHCNIAMMCYDAMKDWNFVSGKRLSHCESHEISNDAASRFMKMCFDVETKA